MQLTILGSGAALPSLKRSGPSYLLKIKDDLILLDVGPGTLRQFEKVKADYFKLTHILISHTHADHLADLMPIIQAISVRTKDIGGGDKKEKPLIIVGPPGFKKVFQFLKKIMSPGEKQYQIKIFEMGNSTKNFKHWKLESKIIKHVPFWKCISYKTLAQDKIFVYSGDTVFCPEILEFCKGADLLLLDCPAPLSDEFPKIFLNPQLAADVAELSSAKKIILTHLYDIDSPADIKKEVAKKFKGKIIIAKDLMKVQL